jgi:diamine N-acetyltransferase
MSRLMVDRHSQGRGYGRAATQIVIARRPREIPAYREIQTLNDPENAVAAKLCEELGFKKTGKVNDRETVVCMKAR